MKAKVLVVDDDPNIRKTLSDILRVKGYETTTASTGGDAIAAAEQQIFSLTLIDLMLPDIPGLDVMARIKALSPLTETIILTGHASIDTAIEATRQGAFSYLIKPYQLDDLLQKIGHAVERQQANDEILRLASFPRLHPNPVIEVNAAGEVTYANPAAHRFFPDITSLGRQHPLLAGLSAFGEFQKSEPQTDIIREVDLGATTYELHVFYVQEAELVRIYILDITERRRVEIQLAAQYRHVEKINAQLVETNRQLEQAQNQLLQSEKMAAIGILAAGVAHEINNPIAYVNSNLGTLEKYLAHFFFIMDKYEAAEALPGTDLPIFQELRQYKAKINLERIRRDSRQLITESQQGLARVKKIILDLKEFSHANNRDHWVLADIHQGLDSTLNIVSNELKSKGEVIKEYGSLPQIYCIPSELNQVFMNLLMNAGQAIDAHGTITLRTGGQDERVWVEVQDTGIGIPPENIARLFEPFFTTKPVGQGTGLGLSVSYRIVEKHHGKIEVHSEVGKGSTFRVWLPVRQADTGPTT
ncbi:MAG: ATP-binding protein [Gallionella sp.]|nr:ATP-binding protein [Gallionella sp.]